MRLNRFPARKPKNLALLPLKAAGGGNGWRGTRLATEPRSPADQARGGPEMCITTSSASGTYFCHPRTVVSEPRRFFVLPRPPFQWSRSRVTLDACGEADWDSAQCNPTSSSPSLSCRLPIHRHRAMHRGHAWSVISLRRSCLESSRIPSLYRTGGCGRLVSFQPLRGLGGLCPAAIGG